MTHLLSGWLFLFTASMPSATITADVAGFENIPIDLWVERTGRIMPLSAPMPMAEEFRIWIENHSETAILVIVLKKKCGPAGASSLHHQADCGVAEEYFYYRFEDNSPIGPGEQRSISLVLSARHATGTHYTVVPHSLLFEDGTSFGKREPYANKYLETLLPSIRRRESSKVSSREIPNDSERAWLEKIREIAGAIVTESARLEEQSLTAPNRPPSR
ncbi:MAG: hypothetical protein V3T83_12940 [Acidobacteriota bacterium]